VKFRTAIINMKFNFFKCVATVDNMASKGLRAISYQGKRKVEADYKPSNTTETLIGYIVCWHQLFFIYHYICPIPCWIFDFGIYIASFDFGIALLNICF